MENFLLYILFFVTKYSSYFPNMFYSSWQQTGKNCFILCCFSRTNRSRYLETHLTTFKLMHLAEKRIMRRNWQRIWMLEICDSISNSSAQPLTRFIPCSPPTRMNRRKKLWLCRKQKICVWDAWEVFYESNRNRTPNRRPRQSCNTERDTPHSSHPRRRPFADNVDSV